MDENVLTIRTAQHEGYWQGLNDAGVPFGEAVALFEIRWDVKPPPELTAKWSFWNEGT